MYSSLMHGVWRVAIVYIQHLLMLRGDRLFIVQTPVANYEKSANDVIDGKRPLYEPTRHAQLPHYSTHLITTMTSLVIDSYIKLPEAVLDVLDEGQPIFHRVVVEPAGKSDAQPTPTATTTGSSSALIVTNVDEIHSSDHTAVYTAKLDLPGEDELVDVVLKISKAGGPRNDALWREYQRYEDLTQFQGTIIPRCYGLFQAILAEEDAEVPGEPDVVSCLVLAYGGEASAAEFNKNPREFKWVLFRIPSIRCS